MNNVDTKFKIAVLSAILSFVIGVTMSVVALVTADRVSDNTNKIGKVERKDNMKVTTQALKQCQRLKIERAKSNSNSKILYILATQIARSSETAAAKLKASGIYSAKEYHARLIIAKQYDDLAKAIEWTPQTHCREAVFNPDKYKNPQARHFHFKVKVPDLD